MTVEIGEYFAVNYPTIEGGFTVDTDNINQLVNELKSEYAFVSEPVYSKQYGWAIKVYEHISV